MDLFVNDMIHCTDSAEAILDSDVYFVAFDEKCNVCYTLNGPNKLSKLCCNKMIILNITNKLHFTISEKDAYRRVLMFIYMKNVYLFKWVG